MKVGGRMERRRRWIGFAVDSQGRDDAGDEISQPQLLELRTGLVDKPKGEELQLVASRVERRWCAGRVESGEGLRNWSTCHLKLEYYGHN